MKTSLKQNLGSILLSFLFALAGGLPATAANWDGDDAVGNFTYNNNWYGNTPPATGFGNSLFFSYRNNAAQTSLYYDWAWVDFDNISWEMTFPAGLSLNGSGNGINFNQKVENYSSFAQTINIPLSGAKSGAMQIELNPVNGDMILSQPVYNDNNKPYFVYGNNGKMLTVGNTLAGSSSVSLTIAENSLVKLTSVQTFGSSATANIQKGELWIDTGGSLATGLGINLGLADANTAKVWLSAAGGGTAVGQNITVANSGGNKTLGGLNTSGTHTFAGGVTLNGAANLEANQAGGTVAFAGPISGAGALTKTGPGVVTLSGANNYSGATTVAGGTLAVASGAVNGTLSAITQSGGELLVTNATVTLATNSTGVFGVGYGASGVGKVTVGSGGVLNVGNGGGRTFIGGGPSGGTFGNGTLTVTNGGIVNVGAAGVDPNNNIYFNGYGNNGSTSTLNLDGGTFSTARDMGNGSNPNLTAINFNGGTLRAVVASTAFLSGLAAGNVRNGGAVIDTTNVNITIGQTLSHSGIGGDNATDGGLTKIGSGTLTISAGPTYTGPTTNNNGTLTFSVANSLTNHIVINSGKISDPVAANNSSPTATGLGNMTTAGRRIWIKSGGTLEFANNDSVGAATYYSPVSFWVDGGTMSHGSYFVTVGDVILTNGATLTGGNGVVANYNTFNIMGTVTVAGTGASTITTIGSSLTGVHLGNGNVNFVVNPTGGSGADLAVNVPLLNRPGALAAAGFTKTGAGIMALSGTNAYTGTVLVQQGTLRLTGGTSGSPGGRCYVGSSGNTAALEILNGTFNANNGGLDIGVSGMTGANFLFTNGVVNVSGQFVIGAYGTSTGTQGGGTFNISAPFYIGGYGSGLGTGTYTQTGGVCTVTGGINFNGGGPNSGIYNLDGGTLNVNTIVRNGGAGTGTFNFNGGTLKPSVTNASFLQGLTTANVRNNGAVIDSAGVDITIAQPLVHSVIGGDNSIDGGLTKNGLGKLTVSAAPTYTGSTTNNDGTLTFSVANGLNGNFVINGGTLLASVATGGVNPTTSPLGNPQTAGRQITVGSSGTLSFTAHDVLGNAASLPAVGLVLNGGNATTDGHLVHFGPVTLNGGTMTANAGAFAYGFGLHGTVSVTGTGTSTMTSSGASTFYLNNLGTAPTLTQFDVASGAALQVSGVLRNSWDSKVSAVRKTGSGSMTMNVANTFTGNLVIDNGTLLDNVSANSANPTATGLGNMTTAGRTVTVNSGAVLLLNGQDGMGSYQYKTPVTLVANGGTIVNGNAKFMSIGDITLQNGGTLSTSNGAAALFQTFNLRGGITVSGSSGSFISTSGTVNNGLHLGGATIPATTFNIGATGDSTADLTVSASLLDEVYYTGALIKMGVGKMKLNAVNTYAGSTIVSNGVLALGASGSIPNSSNLTVRPGAQFDASAAGGFALGAGKSLTAGRPSSPANDIIGSLTTTGAVQIVGAALAGTMTINGDFTLAGGTLNFDLSSDPSSGNDTIVASGTVALPSVPTTIAVNKLSGTLGNGNYTLISGNSVTGNTNNLVLSMAGGTTRQTFSLTNTGTALQLVVSGNAASLIWTAQTDTNWDFITMNWTNLGTLVAETFYDSDLVTFDDTASAGTVYLTTAFSPAAVMFTNTGLAYDVGGPGSLASSSLSKWGTGSVSFTNSGALTMSLGVTLNGGSLTLNNGAANSFGAVTINSGALAFGSGGLGSAGAVTFGGSGTLQWLSGNTQDVFARLAGLGSGVTATFDLGANNVTAAGAINGAGNWIKTGAGTLTLSANSGTLSGDITVQQGTVVAAASTSATVGGVSTTGPLGNGNIPTRTITVDSGATLMFSAHDVFGNGYANPKLTMVISGTVTNSVVPGFSGAFTTLGPVTLNGGTLSGTGGANGSFQMYSLTTNVTVTGSIPSWIIAGANANNGIHLGSTVSNVITFNVADVTLDPDYDFYVAAPLVDRNGQQGGGPGGLNKAGPGTMALWAANTYTGPTIISQGTLSVFTGGSLNSPTINIIPGAVFDGSPLTGGFTLGAGQTLIGGRSSSPATDVEGTITSGGTITVAGSGTVGTLTINGGLTLTGGTINCDLGGTSDLIALNGPLNLSGITVVSPSFPGGVPLNGTYTIINGGWSLDSGGVINLAVPAAISNTFRTVSFDVSTVSGTVTLTLGGYHALLTWVGNNGNNWDANATVNWDNLGGADKYFNGDSVVFNDTSANGNVTLVGALQPASVTVSNENTTYTVSGAGSIGGTTGLTKNGAGLLAVVTANNNFTGDVNLNNGTTIISGGLLQNPATTALGASGNTRNIFVNPGATLKFSFHDPFGNAPTVNQRTLSVIGGTVQSDGWVVSLGDVVLNGGTMTANGGYAGTYPNIGTFLLNGTITVTGSVASVMHDSGAANSRYLLNFAGGATTFNVAEVTGNSNPDLTVSTIMANGWAGLEAGITKIGAGTMVLAAANIYTGATIVSNGTLRVDGSIGGSGVTVAGGTLAGSGTIVAPVTVLSGGTFSPGASLARITINSNLTLGGLTLMEISKTGLCLSNDQARVTGALTYGGTLTVTASGDALTAGVIFKLFDAGSYAGFFTQTNLPALDGGLVWDTSRLIVDGTIFIPGPPVVITSPQDATAEQCAGTNFSVSFYGPGPFTYYWFHGLNLLAGENSATLTLPSVSASQAGSYSVIISNSYGSVTSAVATLTVTDTVPPVITNCAPPQTIAAVDCQALLPDFTSLIVAGDGCGAVTITQDPLPGTTLGAGVHPITFTVKDAGNNIATCGTTVTVSETTPPDIATVSATQNAADVKNCATNAVMGGVNFAVDASDNCGLVLVAVVLTQGATTETATYTGGAGTVSNFTWTITTATLSGTWTAHAAALDANGNAVTNTFTVCVAPLQVSGQVALDYFSGPAHDGHGTRAVTFKATDGAGVVLTNWTETLTFAPDVNGYGVASFTLSNVPPNTARLSAKTAWNLRQRLDLSFTASAATASFTGTSVLPGGDINGSGRVDIEDYFQLAAVWYQVNAASDIDGSGLVSVDDYFILASHWYEADSAE